MKLDTPTPEEFPFIFSSWAESFMKSPYAGCIRNCDYPEASRRAMAEIIDRGARVTVLVNTLPNGVRRVAGYSVSEPARKILHWVYVKRDYRGMGNGRLLRRDVVADADLDKWTYTYRTHSSDRFLTAKGRRMKWDRRPACMKG
jgi:GNAT superfamily N-acetyltransferase